MTRLEILELARDDLNGLIALVKIPEDTEEKAQTERLYRPTVEALDKLIAEEKGQ